MKVYISHITEYEREKGWGCSQRYDSTIVALDILSIKEAIKKREENGTENLYYRCGEIIPAITFVDDVSWQQSIDSKINQWIENSTHKNILIDINHFTVNEIKVNLYRQVK